MLFYLNNPMSPPLPSPSPPPPLPLPSPLPVMNKTTLRSAFKECFDLQIRTFIWRKQKTKYKNFPFQHSNTLIIHCINSRFQKTNFVRNNNFCFYNKLFFIVFNKTHFYIKLILLNTLLKISMNRIKFISFFDVYFFNKTNL